MVHVLCTVSQDDDQIWPQDGRHTTDSQGFCWRESWRPRSLVHQHATWPASGSPWRSEGNMQHNEYDASHDHQEQDTCHVTITWWSRAIHTSCDNHMTTKNKTRVMWRSHDDQEQYIHHVTITWPPRTRYVSCDDHMTIKSNTYIMRQSHDHQEQDTCHVMVTWPPRAIHVCMTWCPHMQVEHSLVVYKNSLESVNMQIRWSSVMISCTIIGRLCQCKVTAD